MNKQAKYVASWTSRKELESISECMRIGTDPLIQGLPALPLCSHVVSQRESLSWVYQEIPASPTIPS